MICITKIFKRKAAFTSYRCHTSTSSSSQLSKAIFLFQMLQNLRMLIQTLQKKWSRKGLRISTTHTLFLADNLASRRVSSFHWGGARTPQQRQNTLWKVKCLIRSGSISWMKQRISSSMQHFLVQCYFTNLTALNRDFPFCWHTLGEQYKRNNNKKRRTSQQTFLLGEKK